MTDSQLIADCVKSSSINAMVDEYMDIARTEGAVLTGDIGEAIAERVTGILVDSRYGAGMRIKMTVLLIQYDPQRAAQILDMCVEGELNND